MDSTTSNILFNKEGVSLRKTCANDYIIEFKLQNKEISLEPILHLHFLRLIYEINKQDCFDDMTYDVQTNEHATLALKMKHFFQDFGITQRYVFAKIHMIKLLNQVVFDVIPIQHDDIIPPYSPLCEEIPFSTMTSVSTLENPHTIHSHTTIRFPEQIGASVPEMIESLSIKLFCNVLLRTKRFIETMKVTV